MTLSGGGPNRAQTMPNINPPRPGSSGTGNNPPPVQSLWPPRTHSRVDASMPQAGASSPAGLSTSVASTATLVAAAPTKAHSAPSKPTAPSRGYDGKHSLPRDLHRMHQGSLGSSTTVAAASSSSLQLPASAIAQPPIAVSLSGDNPWGSLHVYVLPLFNGEPLRIPIEDLNALVRKHIQGVLSISPSKALNTLEHDANELIGSGMVTLNAKLAGIEDQKLLGRVVEIWGFFWDQVLPYVEGVLLPLQTDALLTSLYRTPKSHRPNRSGSVSSLMLQSTYHIDVRKLVLRAFRDKIILPIAPRLMKRLASASEESFFDPSGYQGPRFQQMLLVLISQAHHNPTSLNVSEEPTPGERVLVTLLQTIRSPPALLDSPSSSPSAPPKVLSPITIDPQPPQPQPMSRVERHTSARPRAPSFIAHARTGDRRAGRIAKHPSVVAAALAKGFGNVGGKDGEENTMGLDAEKELEFLELLRGIRSPGAETPDGAATGGWGLDADHEEANEDDQDDEDETMDWGQTQDDVERMVGMKPPEVTQSETRPRRGT